jgi:ribosomal protein L13
MVLTKTKIIDGRDHLLGRLASVVAKELLAGQTIVIVRCDEIAVSGSRKFTSVVYSVVPGIHIDKFSSFPVAIS